MAKISFGKTVRYNGNTIPPNTPFEVLDEEVEDLRKAGGWVEASVVESKEEAPTDVKPEPQKKKPAKKPQ